MTEYATNEQVRSYIIQRAQMQGVDPNVTLRVVGHEGGTEVAALGQFATGWSWWPFQLHYGGAGYERFGYTAGMGNDFTALTGWNPGDPAAWRASVDFALDEVVKTGWGKWYGAAAEGITGFMGIDPGAQTLGILPENLPQSYVPDPVFFGAPMPTVSEPVIYAEAGPSGVQAGPYIQELDFWSGSSTNPYDLGQLGENLAGFMYRPEMGGIYTINENEYVGPAGTVEEAGAVVQNWYGGETYQEPVYGPVYEPQSYSEPSYAFEGSEEPFYNPPAQEEPVAWQEPEWFDAGEIWIDS